MELTKGKKAVLKRARMLTEFEWTPLRDIPIYTKKTGKTVLKAGEHLKGMLYSSTEPTDKFVCENVSFETFRSVVNNVNSALYEKNLGGHNNSWAYFGIVCNGLVRFALNLNKFRYSTKRWLTIPGMKEIAKPEEYTINELEICDILYAFGNGRNHVAIVTDIIKDINGKVCLVEVSEAIRPVCVRRTFTTEQYYNNYKAFGICRYEYIDSVPEPDDAFKMFFHQNSVSYPPSISIDCGTKSNYHTNEIVTISAVGEIEIFKDDTLFKIMTVKDKITQKFETGYYKVKNISTGEEVFFCVTEPHIKHIIKDGIITVIASSGDSNSKLHHFEFREARHETDDIASVHKDVTFYNPICSSLSKMEELTEEEKNTGIIIRRIPDDAANYKVYFENAYGIWTHPMRKIY